MNPLEPIVISFVNKSFELGEWLLKEGVLTKDDLDECGNEIIVGLPLLAILHCVEKSANFDDGCVHLAVNKMISPYDPAYNNDIRKILHAILAATHIYRRINFNYNSYEDFKKGIILKIKDKKEFYGELNELYKILYGVSLGITQIEEYKQKFINVINFLSTLDIKNQ